MGKLELIYNKVKKDSKLNGVSLAKKYGVSASMISAIRNSDTVEEARLNFNRPNKYVVRPKSSKNEYSNIDKEMQKNWIKKLINKFRR